MKLKLVVASLSLIALLFVSTVTVLAAGGPENMPEETADHLVSDVEWKIFLGWIQGYTNSKGATPLTVLDVTTWVFGNLLDGIAPGKSIE